MSNQKKYFIALILTWTAILIPSMYYAYMQVKENKIVDQYLYLNNLIGLPISKETAVRVSDQVRRDFNVNKSCFVVLKMAERPFLREDAGFLLTHKEGLCGEGTRVIVNLLNRLGFDATRLNIIDRKLQSGHTLVSVVIDGQEFFVDSLNSSEATNDLLKKNIISSNDFFHMHNSDNIVKRREFVISDKSYSQEGYVKFFNYYWIYSYGAIPFSKLLTKIGFDVIVLNFNRPNKLVSVMAEQPNMVMFIVTFIASVFTMFLLHKLRVIRNILRMNTAKQSGDNQ